MNESNNQVDLTGNPESKVQLGIDIVLFAVLVQIYAMTTKKDFAYSLGQLAVIALFGMGLYRLIDRFIFKGKFSTHQSKFRQYLIGAYLISVVILPLLISQAQAKEKHDNIKSQISFAAGEIHMSCEFSKHLKAQICPGLKLTDEMKKVCQVGVGSLTPASMRADVQSSLSSEKAMNEVKKFQEQADRNIANAKTQPNYSDAALCKAYEELLGKTYSQGSSKINALSSELAQ